MTNSPTLGRPYSPTNLSSPLIGRLGERVAFDLGVALGFGVLSNVHEDGMVTLVDPETDIVVAVEPEVRVYDASLADAEALAAQMMELVREDVGSGLVPAEVACWTDLHDHVDANEYGLHAEEALDWADRPDKSWEQRLALFSLADAICDAKVRKGEHRPPRLTKA